MPNSERMVMLEIFRAVALHAAAALVVSFTLPAAAEPLDGAVRTAMGNAKLGNAKVGVAVMDCSSRELLATINATDLFAPASNLKLVTSGVALSILNDFEFKTGFAVSPDGRLVIKGSGDPAFCDPKLLEEQGWSVERFIQRIVDAAQAAKVPAIKEVIVDDRVFEREPGGAAAMVHPTWPREQLNQWYCAPVSGMNFFTNVIELRATPAERAGLKPNVTTEPSAPWLINLDLSSTRTVSQGANSLWAQQDRASAGGGSDFTFKVFGDIRRPVEKPVEVTVTQPGLLFAHILGHELQRAGLAVAGRLPVRMAADNEDLASISAAPFAMITTPLSATLARCNEDSQNLYAEALLKRTAHEVTQQPGSWGTGSQVITMRLTEKVGPEAQKIRIVDGSGLSKDNQITPAVMVKWLSVMQQDRRLSPVFLESMARADARDSKLFRRFGDRKLNGTVYAKTGYIKNVRGLSGYVISGDRAVAYCVIANDIGATPHQRVMDFQEDVVTIIDKWLARQTGVAGAN